MKAVVYSRFSTDRQTESSIADQVRVCSEHAAKHGWTVARHYEDQGISGAAIENRPGVSAMLTAAKAGEIGVILVMDLSRLSRSTGQLNVEIDRLVARGVRVIGVQDGYDTARKGHKLQAGLSGIIGEAFREMIKDRTYTALETRARTERPTGGRAYGYRESKIAEAEAPIVREIFERFAAGESCRTIAAGLNARGVPSPGSTWKRSERRCSGWMGSGIRAIVVNDRYTGRIVWNRSEWRKDPDSGKRVRRERPKADWITRYDASTRLVSDDLWQRVQARLRPVGTDTRLKAGGKPRFLLSGLLRCESCGANYVMVNAESYGCASHHDGKSCENAVSVKREHIQDIIVGPVRDELLSPSRIERMAREMQSYYAERIRASETRAAEVPRELQDLGARIDRLRDRLRTGDPDMPADEIQVAIDRAEAKRQELESAQPAARASATVLAMLPKAARLYRDQIRDGLDGDVRAAAKARVILRGLFGGEIRLLPQADGGLIAEWDLHSAALLKAVGTCGSGGLLCDAPSVPQRAVLKYGAQQPRGKWSPR